MNDIEKKLLAILKSFNEDIPDDTKTNLLSCGYVDSFDIANIVAELEETFNVEIIPEKIVPENFVSVEHIASLIERTQNDKT